MFKGSFRTSTGGGGGGSANLVWASVGSGQSPFTVWGNVNAVAVDLTNGNVTVRLPAAAAHTGEIFTVKHDAGSIAANTLTVSSAGGTIDGLATINILQTQSSTRLSSDGSNWKVI